MKILTLTPWYPNPENKTAGIFVKDQCCAVASRLGHDVTVISPFASGKPSEMTIDRIEFERGTLTEILVPYRPEVTIFDKYVKRKRAVKRGFETLDFKPDVFHVHEYQMVPIAKSLIRDVPVVLTEHSSTISNLGIKRNFAVKAFNASDSIIAVSQFQKRRISSLSKDANVTVVSNFVNDVFFGSEKYGFKGKGCALVSVGGLVEIKGFDLLIRSFADLEKRFKLTIVGNGSQMGNLKTLASELGVSDRIVFTGALDKEGVSNELSRSDIFLSASKIESFGIALLEALAVGLPVVTYDNGGISDFVKDFCGIVVSEYTPEAFSKAVKKICENYGSYDCQKIREYVRSNFSSGTFAQKMEMVYEEVLKVKLKG